MSSFSTFWRILAFICKQAPPATKLTFSQPIIPNCAMLVQSDFSRLKKMTFLQIVTSQLKTARNRTGFPGEFVSNLGFLVSIISKVLPSVTLNSKMDFFSDFFSEYFFFYFFFFKKILFKKIYFFFFYICFIYRTRAIISRGLYFFYPIFHCG